MKKTLLIITDGIGHKPNSKYNAFLAAKKPTYDKLFATLPHSLLTTHSLSVGLPEGQMGNSEVGHLTIGAGRVLYQDLVKITKSLNEGTLKENKVFKKMVEKNETVHLIGLLSDGGVHSHIDHIMGVATLLEEAGKRVYLHLLTDGRDVSPTSSPLYLSDIEPIISDKITLATIGGRYYGMDRDNRWERIKLAYEAIVNATPKTTLSAKKYIEMQYADGITDEFVVPTAFGNYKGMKDGDGVIMMNFRSDRMRQITQLLGERSFMPIDVKKVELDLITMTQYNESFNFPVLFTKDNPQNTLSEVISKAGLRQFHTAETEKYAHVTFFFNGGVETPFENETRVLIPSPKVATYDLEPRMSADQVGDAVVKAVGENYDFIVVNFANGDMVGHTGNYDAAIKAVEAVDENIGKILAVAEKAGYNYIITSDHGNCEEMKDSAGNPLTNHTVGDVWCFIKADGVSKISNGGLSNVAPTLLKMMGLTAPKEMDKPLY